jgi:hypothetical protein
MREVMMSPEQLQAFLAVLWEMLAKEFATTRRIDDTTYAFDFAAGPIPIACYCQINPQIRAFLVRGGFQLPIESEYLPSVSEFLHRVNYSLPVGGWAINLENGEVRWKSGFIFPEGELPEELMFHAIGSSLSTIKEHILALVSLWNGERLEEALKRVGEDPGEGYIVPMQEDEE